MALNRSPIMLPFYKHLLGCRRRLPQVTNFRCLFASVSNGGTGGGSLLTPTVDEARVVICGGGLVGTCIATHISKKWPNSCIVLDASLDEDLRVNVLNSAPMSYFNSNPLEALLIRYGIKYFDLKPTGSLFLASNSDRVTSFRRTLGSLKTVLDNQSQPQLLSPTEVKQGFNCIETEDIKGAVWVPMDSIVQDVNALRHKLMEDANREGGVVFYEGWQLKRILVVGSKLVGVEVVNLSNGDINQISCEYFVNCAGFWARDVGRLSMPQVKTPALSCEHQMLETKLPPDEQLTQLDQFFSLYDCDNRLNIYRQEKDNSLIITGYPLVSKPINEQDSTRPETIRNTMRLGLVAPQMAPNWDAFSPFLSNALKRVDCLKELQFRKMYTTAQSWSPDGRPIVGQSAEIMNYYIAAAGNCELSAGIGKVIADQITGNREDPFDSDFWAFDPRRFVSLHNNKAFLMDRVQEIPARATYGINCPSHYDDYVTGHCLRVSPIYPRLQEAGAIFVQIMGYERPALYYNPEESEDQDAAKLFALEVDDGFSGSRHKILETHSFGRPQWLDTVKREYEACRHKVGLCDYSSFTKLEISSPGDQVVRFLQKLCSNDIDIPVGHMVHTGMQNERGGYENDVSLVRLAPNRYMLVGPTEQQTRCMSWIQRHMKDNSVHAQDITSVYTAISVMGPYSKILLSELVSEPEELRTLALFTYKEFDMGLASGIRICGLTHTGEQGVVLYIPNEHALHVYDLLFKAGAKYGVKMIGSIAMRTLRIEKFYAFWGQDLDTTTTPLECGRAFRVKFDKDFIGREALLKQREEGIKRRYVQLVLENFEEGEEGDNVWPWGGEPIYVEGFGKPVGVTTTTAYGFTLEKQVCLGFVCHPDPAQTVTNDYVLKSTFEVEIGGIRYPAKVNIHSPKLTDPSGGTYVATQ